jgi:hypothetical protein
MVYLIIKLATDAPKVVSAFLAALKAVEEAYSFEGKIKAAADGLEAIAAALRDVS